MPNLTPAESAILNELTAQPIVDKGMKAEKANQPPKPPPKKCDIKDMLRPSEAQMLEAFPMNETIRTVVAARLKTPVPIELDTFQKIRDWIESTFEVNKVKPPEMEYVLIPIQGSEHVSGSCHFSGRRSGVGDVKFRPQELIDLIRECESMDDLLHSVAEEIGERGGENLIDMDGPDDGYDYDSHEITDSDGGEWDWPSRSEVKVILADAVRRLAPDTAEAWGL